MISSLKKYLCANIAWIIALFFVVFPFVVTIYYSTPSSDDFSMCSLEIRDGQVGRLSESIRQTIDAWFNWTGGLPDNFVQVFFNPLSIGSASGHATGITMLVLFVCFVFVLFYYIRTLLRDCFGINNGFCIKITSISLLFLILNSKIYYEIFYWFVGGTYLRMLMLALLAQISVIKYFRKKTYKSCILASFAGFLSCFTIVYCVFNGLVYLIEFIKELLKKKVTFKDLIPICFMLCGGILGVFAPGNFARQDSMQEVHYISDAIVMGFQNENDAFFEMITNPIYVVVVALLIYVGYKWNNGKLREYNPILIFLSGFISVYAMCFSVAYGNGGNISNYEYMPNRLYFVFNIGIILWSLIVAIPFGGWLKSACSMDIDFKLIATALAAAFIVLSLQINPNTKQRQVYGYPSVYTLLNINDIVKESRYTKAFLKEIENSESDDVVVHWNFYWSTGVLKSIELSDDPSDWVNVAIARYYGKKTITVVFPK